MWYEFDEANKKVMIRHPRQIGTRWIRSEEVPEILLYPDDNPRLELIKIDDNGTKYYKSDICPSCGGCGFVYMGSVEPVEYSCNKCNGTGKLEKAKVYKIHTHVYGIELEKEYVKTETVKYYIKEALNEDGSTYVYIGNTYPLKDVLKAKGAIFDSLLSKWRSKDVIEGFEFIKVKMPLKTYEGGYIGIDYGCYENNGSCIKNNHLYDEVRQSIVDADRNLKVNKKKREDVKIYVSPAQYFIIQFITLLPSSELNYRYTTGNP